MFIKRIYDPYKNTELESSPMGPHTYISTFLTQHVKTQEIFLIMTLFFYLFFFIIFTNLLNRGVDWYVLLSSIWKTTTVETKSFLMVFLEIKYTGSKMIIPFTVTSRYYTIIIYSPIFDLGGLNEPRSK